jgi:hypothetical protein
MKSKVVILYVIIFFLSIALTISIRNRPTTKHLKAHIANLSDKHLRVSRQILPQIPEVTVPRDYGYDNFPFPYGSPIHYQHGLEGPMKFYRPVEQRYNNIWQKVGIVMSVSPNDDTIFNLEQRAVFPFTEESFEYRVNDTFKGVYINLPRQYGRKLYNREKFKIPGKESIGLFEVARDTDYYMIPV